MSRPKAEDRSVPVVVAPAKFCPRKLRPEGPNVKRYMSKGPLAGYMIACPACGFTELHMDEKVHFRFRQEPEATEFSNEGRLTGITCPPRCMYCARVITIDVDPATDESVLHAKQPTPVELPM